jgi:hypothetical protein
MNSEVPAPGFENRVLLRLHVTEPNWACRQCIARTLEFTLRDVKIALLRLARFHGAGYIDTAYDVCEQCEAVTAVLRLARPDRVRRIARDDQPHRLRPRGHASSRQAIAARWARMASSRLRRASAF